MSFLVRTPKPLTLEQYGDTMKWLTEGGGQRDHRGHDQRADHRCVDQDPGGQPGREHLHARVGPEAIEVKARNRISAALVTSRPPSER